MGTVLKAVHETLERPVALKILPAEFSMNPEYVSRFLREARVVATLRHDNVVQVYDAGTQDGKYFIAMELIDGESLGKYLQSAGSLTQEEGLQLLLQAAKGLQVAHEKGLVHRDIKPDNLLLSKDHKTLRIVDFGLVMESSSNTQLTATGACLGTPQYMSPEQADGEQADARTDIYSLGVTFFMVFTGQPPFNSPTVMNLLFKHKFEPPPDPRSINSKLGLNVSNLILTMMAKRREDRPQTATDLVALVEKVIEGKRIPPPPAFVSPVTGEASVVQPLSTGPMAAISELPPRTKLALAGGALVGVVALIAIGAWMFGGGKKDDPATASGSGGEGKTAAQGSSGGGGTAKTPASAGGATNGGGDVAGVEAQRSELLAKTRGLLAAGDLAAAQTALDEAAALGPSDEVASLQKQAKYQKLSGEAESLAKDGKTGEAIRKAEEAQSYGDADALLARLRARLGSQEALDNAKRAEAEGQKLNAANFYETAAGLSKDPAEQKRLRDQAALLRFEHYTKSAEGAQAGGDWRKAADDYRKALEVRDDSAIRAKAEAAGKRAEAEDTYRKDMAAGQQALDDGIALLNEKKDIGGAKVRLTQARGQFNSAYLAIKDFDNRSEPGDKLTLVTGYEMIAQGDEAAQRGRASEARETYQRVSRTYPALATVADARLAGVKAAAPVETAPKDVQGRVMQLVDAGRTREARDLVVGALKENPNDAKLQDLKRGLDNLLSCETIFGSTGLQRIILRGKDAVADVQVIDAADDLARRLDDDLDNWRKQCSNNLEIARANVKNSLPELVASTVSRGKELAAEIAERMDGANTRYGRKAEEAGESTGVKLPVKVPIFGKRVGREADQDKARKYRAVADKFEELEQAARTLSR
ncbi:MAG: protein kinase [Planctomycetes bacterium]|nr:protein kinase [Planctomycetota bacterium]